jgi:outer membrane biosynthesis protein TonB
VHGATGKPLTLRRETLVSPRAVRRLRVGRISGAPGSEAFKVKCSPLADLTARVAAGECAARPAQSIDLAAIYPRESRKREETGRVTLYVIAPTPAGIPIHTEVAYGSAFALLDAAALEATRALPFRSECASGVGFIRFAFEFRLGN